MIAIDILAIVAGLLAGFGLALSSVPQREHYLGVLGALVAAGGSIWAHRVGLTSQFVVGFIVDLAAVPVVAGMLTYCLIVAYDERRPPVRRRELVSNVAATVAFILGSYAVFAIIAATI